tara:strand:- start:248 stop:748 length:501 start_codon:yes stop_codon:yes gene_type:complete
LDGLFLFFGELFKSERPYLIQGKQKRLNMNLQSRYIVILLIVPFSLFSQVSSPNGTYFLGKDTRKGKISLRNNSVNYMLELDSNNNSYILSWIGHGGNPCVGEKFGSYTIKKGKLIFEETLPVGGEKMVIKNDSLYFTFLFLRRKKCFAKNVKKRNFKKNRGQSPT